MSEELDEVARYLRENPKDHDKSPSLDELLAHSTREPCQHRYARYDAASNCLWCPTCCEDV